MLTIDVSEAETPSGFAALIDRWPSAAEFSRDINVSFDTVRGWRPRNSIPAGYWPDVIAAAQKRGFSDVTVELLTSFVIPRKNAGRAA
jgi:hypothetical protein